MFFSFVFCFQIPVYCCRVCQGSYVQYAVMPREEFCANVDDARTVYFIVGKAVGALRASASSSLQRLVIVLTSK